MVSLYTSLWAFGLLWWSLHRRLPKLPVWGLVLLVVPIALDGTTHLLSDLAGIGQGFRDMNLWLAALTHNSFRPEFYAGDAWGSFNSLMRLLTGILFGLGIVWFGFPYLDGGLSRPADPVRAPVPTSADYAEKHSDKGVSRNRKDPLCERNALW